MGNFWAFVIVGSVFLITSPLFVTVYRQGRMVQRLEREHRRRAVEKQKRIVVPWAKEVE